MATDLTRFDLGRTQRLPSLDLRQLLGNLVLLRSRHHILVHAQGLRLQPHPDRSLTVTTADGVTVLHHPALPWRPAEELDTPGHIEPSTLPPTVTGQRLDLGYAVAIVLQQVA